MTTPTRQVMDSQMKYVLEMDDYGFWMMGDYWTILNGG